MAEKMKTLFRLSVVTTSVSALSLFILSNTVLALTVQRYCIVYLEVPFTDKTIRLPDWMGGRYPLLVCVVSTAAAIALWIVFFARRMRMRREASLITPNL